MELSWSLVLSPSSRLIWLYLVAQVIWLGEKSCLGCFAGVVLDKCPTGRKSLARREASWTMLDTAH
jgi:hypothetical protein